MFKFTVELFPNLFRSFSNQHHFPEKNNQNAPYTAAYITLPNLLAFLTV